MQPDEIKGVWILEFTPFPDSTWEQETELLGIFDTQELALAAIPAGRDVEWKQEEHRSWPVGYDAWGQRWYCRNVMYGVLLISLYMHEDDDQRVR